MKNLIIIGGGGMGREVYNLACQCNGSNPIFKIKGFLDDNPKSLTGLRNSYPPIISKIKDYSIEENDVFICSIGNVKVKKICTEIILNKGGIFISLIHPTALVNSTSKLGEGCLVFPYAIVGSEAVIGNSVLLQSFSVLAHDVVIGNYSRVDVRVLCVGGVEVGNSVTIHSAAILNHKVVVEDGAIVGATSFVIKRVKKDTTVFGNPAREL